MKGQAATKLRKVSDEAVLYILQAHCMCRPADIAEEVGTTAQTVRDIRNNKLYRDMYPEIERKPFWSRRGGCAGCRHFKKQEIRGSIPNTKPRERTKSSCDYDFPEFKLVSTNAGLDCNWFEPR